jgi:translation initiation factor IF-3
MLTSARIANQGGPISDLRINDQIRTKEVRLVGPAGEQVGIVSIDKALQLAADVDLDLVEVAPTARPPVCKLMDYGKYKYESAQKARASRRNQQQTVIKEMKLRPKIDKHDYETKKGHIVRFLTAGDKVKITIMFRGREQSRPELGRRLLDKLAEELSDLAIIESAAKQDGRNMIMVVAPIRPKGEIIKSNSGGSGGGRKSRGGGDAEQAEAAPEAAPAAAPEETPAEAPAEVAAEAPAETPAEAPAAEPAEKQPEA